MSRKKRETMRKRRSGWVRGLVLEKLALGSNWVCQNAISELPKSVSSRYSLYALSFLIRVANLLTTGSLTPSKSFMFIVEQVRKKFPKHPRLTSFRIFLDFNQWMRQKECKNEHRKAHLSQQQVPLDQKSIRAGSFEKVHHLFQHLNETIARPSLLSSVVSSKWLWNEMQGLR